jgi:uncharacterized protein YkwD
MKNKLILFLACLLGAGLTGTATAQKYRNEMVIIKHPELKKGLEYLNQIRSNPSAYSTKLGVNLSYVQPRNALIWIDVVAVVAQAKAEDMARRHYFDHIDPDGNGINIKLYEAGYIMPTAWVNDPKSNYFESLGCGYSNVRELINGLIIDKNTPSLGHRKHLLGINDFWANCYDAGIGYATDKNGTPYWCVIIAKHNW